MHTNEVATAGNGVVEELRYLLSMMDKLGGPESYNHYPVARCTPWRHHSPGPSRSPRTLAARKAMVMSWPKRVADGGALRSQFHHVIDIPPTVLQAAGVTFPAVLNGVPQKPVDGVSIVYSWNDANAPSTRKTQYFELSRFYQLDQRIEDVIPSSQRFAGTGHGGQISG